MATSTFISVPCFDPDRVQKQMEELLKAYQKDELIADVYVQHRKHVIACSSSDARSIADSVSALAAVCQMIEDTQEQDWLQHNGL